jgi:hypothetical protein
LQVERKCFDEFSNAMPKFNVNFAAKKMPFPDQCGMQTKFGCNGYPPTVWIKHGNHALPTKQIRVHVTVSQMAIFLEHVFHVGLHQEIAIQC